MRIVSQNVKEASVFIDKKLYSKINKGFLLLVSFCNKDTYDIVDKMVTKLLKMRVFPDENGKTNLSIKDVNGEILSVSQFTLYGSIKKGNRPSFIDKCLDYDESIKLYDYFNNKILDENIELKTGIFGADMEVSLINEGPFTMILDSEELF